MLPRKIPLRHSEKFHYDTANNSIIWPIKTSLRHSCRSNSGADASRPPSMIFVPLATPPLTFPHRSLATTSTPLAASIPRRSRNCADAVKRDDRDMACVPQLAGHAAIAARSETPSDVPSALHGSVFAGIVLILAGLAAMLLPA